MPSENFDIFYMRRAVCLARRGQNVSPNPRVGAVVVKENRILSQGYHALFGGPHAEIEALNGLSREQSSDATLYVTLEPCSHFGKTPPCTEAIIRSGIRRVVISHLDPNPIVNGSGVRILREAGIEVETGLLSDLSQGINPGYIKSLKTGLPFLTIKIAQSLDGRIAACDGNSRWITGDIARRRVHRLRQEHDAVMVGINTVICDNPSLNIRYGLKGEVKKLILDPDLMIPENSEILKDAQSCIFACLTGCDGDKRSRLNSLGASVWEFSGNGRREISVKELGAHCVKHGVTSVLVEGGSKVFSSVLSSGLTDRLIIFTAPKLLANGLQALQLSDRRSMDDVITFKRFHWKKAGEAMVFIGDLSNCLPD